LNCRKRKKLERKLKTRQQAKPGSDIALAEQIVDRAPSDKERTCIVTRQAMPADELIRFVVAPDGAVMPDLARRLPGRGVWVSARAILLVKAVERNLFARGFRRDVVVPASLVATVDALMEASALKALSLAKKAGQVVAGFHQVDAAVRSARAALVLHALDAAADGIRKLEQAVHAAAADTTPDVLVRQIWNSAQMDLALGGHNVIHAAAIRGGAASALIGRIDKLDRFRS
jgi:uncharacterized protein